jgi:hypothetical protein
VRREMWPPSTVDVAWVVVCVIEQLNGQLGCHKLEITHHSSR